MVANTEIESMLGRQMPDPADNTSLYRRYGFPALVVLGLVAVAGLAGHSSAAVGFRGAMDSQIIGLAKTDAPQDDAADIPDSVEAPGGVAWTVAWDSETGKQAVEEVETVLKDADMPSDQVEAIEATMTCVGIGEACRSVCLATGAKCREFWLAEDYDWTTYTTDNKKCQDDEQSCGTKCNSDEEECAKAVDAKETAADEDAEKEIEAVSAAVESAKGVDGGEVKTIEETVNCDEVGVACRQTCLDTAKTCRTFWQVADYDWNNWSTDSTKCTDAEQSCGGKCNSDEETCLNGVSQ